MSRPKLTHSYIKTYMKSFNYKLLSTKYVGAHYKLQIQCPENHIFNMCWNNFKTGHRCKCCSNKTNNKDLALTYKFVKSEIEKIGYKLLSKTYKNCSTKLKIQCDKNHIYKVIWSNFKAGQRCPKCKKPSYWRGGPDAVWFDMYALQIDFCEKVRRDPENRDLLQVKCTNSDCKKWFTPSRQEISSRLTSINSINRGENRFYCSDECKHSCVLFRQRKYLKGFKPDSSRPEQKDWADAVKLRDNYECQLCGSKENISAHHFEGIYQNPIESADIDAGITLCKICEKKVHSQKGCRYVDLQRKNLCKTINN